MNNLSIELYWLTLTSTMTAIMWLPYILNRMTEQGLLAAICDPYGETATKVAWADRMMKAHHNAVENLVVFAPLVIALQLTGSNTSITAVACMVYFFARLLHFLAFTFAVPVLRVLTFLTGFAMQIILVLAILQW